MFMKYVVSFHQSRYSRSLSLTSTIVRLHCMHCIDAAYCYTDVACWCVFNPGWWHGTVVERRSLAGELSLYYTRPAADG